MNKDEKRNVIKSGIFNKSGDKKFLVNYRNLIRFKIDFITASRFVKSVRFWHVHNYLIVYID